MAQSEDEKELLELKAKYNFTIPDRKLNSMQGMNLQWRGEIPDYTKADLFYFKGKSKNHSPGSLEMSVENLVKRWEMEITHLLKPEECSTMSKNFKIKVNDDKQLSAMDYMVKGSYNPLLKSVPKELYDSDAHSFDSSMSLFHGAFTEGFGWELLHVFSGPPNVAFTWRHWGKFSGEYGSRKGTGEIIEMYGFLRVTVNDKMEMDNIEVYFRPECLLEALEGKKVPAENWQGKSLFGDCCPIHQQN